MVRKSVGRVPLQEETRPGHRQSWAALSDDGVRNSPPPRKSQPANLKLAVRVIRGRFGRDALRVAADLLARGGRRHG
jgi:hypothetical protein